MSERLADISVRINGIAELGSVVNAMRGIAGGKAQRARMELVPVDRYAETIAISIGRALVMLPEAGAGAGRAGRTALLVFCAEEGFAGNFSERILDALGDDAVQSPLFLVGTRGVSIAAARGLTPVWTSRLPAHSTGVPRFADTVAEALYARIAAGRMDRLDAVFGHWRSGQELSVERRALLPLDDAAFPRGAAVDPPLLNLPPADLLAKLSADYVHAQICQAALHAFAAENEARMQAMAAAHREIDRQLDQLRSRQRIVRQDEITAEIIELASGEAATRMSRHQMRP